MLGYKVKLYDGSFQEWSRLAGYAGRKSGRQTSAKPAFRSSRPQWLEEHAADANLRIIDVRQNVYDYFAGHVPNAVHLADSAMRFPTRAIRHSIPKRL